MSNGSGVSVSSEGQGKYRVRWREMVDQDGERKTKQREKVVHSEQAMIELRSNVLRAIETEGAYIDPARKIHTAPSIESIAIEYIKERAAYGLEPRTIATEGQRLRSALAIVRRIVGLPVKAPVPADVLSRAVLVELVSRGRAEGHAETTLRSMARCVLRVWTFGHDTAEKPGIPSPPRSDVGLLPRTPPRSAPEAPTMAECDACLRAMKAKNTRAKRSLALAIVMRWTGLRIGQVLGAMREDLDEQTLTMRIRVGKSAQEKADQRIVVVSQSMIDDIRPMMGDDPKGPLIKRQNSYTGEGKAGGDTRPDGILKLAWEAATLAGHVRRYTWQPPNRRLARPDHAFRASLQTHLVLNGVQDEVIDLLVGHAGSTRAKAYVSWTARSEAMRKAIDTIPPIDWNGPQSGSAKAPEALPDNVIPLSRAS